MKYRMGRAEVRVAASVLGSMVLASAFAVRPARADEPKRKVPLYTNEDLDRVSPYRDQTGGSSRPATTTETRETRGTQANAAGPGRSREGAVTGRSRATGETYWRHAWEQLQDRLQPLRDRAEALRLRTEERRRKPGVHPYSDPQIEGWQRQRDALLARVHDREDRFQEQARRAGALPGWLR